MLPLLLDICWTTYFSNTTFDFVDYVVKRKSYHLAHSVRKTRVGQACSALLFRLLRRDLMREYAVRQLRGMSEEEIMQQARLFIDRLDTDQRNTKAWDIITRYSDIRLISTTISPIAYALADKYHWQVMSTNELIFSRHIATGKTAAFNPSDKLTSLQLSSLPAFDILTDNTSDLNLILRSRHAYIITYNNLKRWQQLLPDHSNLSFININLSRY